MRQALLAVVWISCLASSAIAGTAPVSWHLSHKDRSYLDFRAFWEGTGVPGKFPRFTVKAKIDSKLPAQDQLEVIIDTAKVTMKSPNITQEIRGKTWFDIVQFPTAKFRSTRIRTFDGQKNSLLVTGRLTLKGRSHQMVFPLTVRGSGNTLTLAGHFSLNRNRYSIGTGNWEAATIIGTKVEVSFLVHLSKVRPGE